MFPVTRRYDSEMMPAKSEMRTRVKRFIQRKEIVGGGRYNENTMIKVRSRDSFEN